MTKILGISGSLSTPSRTRTLVETIVRQINISIHGKTEIIDLAENAEALWRSSYPPSPDVQRLFDKITEADILVVGSPVYKGSYSGLFKHFFDLLDPKALSGKLVVLSATGGSDYHALVLEHQLRPLFGFFGAITAPLGVYAKEADFLDGNLLNPRIAERIGDLTLHVHRLVSPSQPQKAVA